MQPKTTGVPHLRCIVFTLHRVRDTRGTREGMMKAICRIAAALSLLLAGDALAQTSYPEQPVRILVGFTPGTAPDVTARLLADKFTEGWGKAVIVENVTGAGGNIACDRVAKSPPDGYTLTMCGNGNLIMGPSLYEKLPFD